MPPSLQFPFKPGENEYYIPYRLSVKETANPLQNDNRILGVICRLRESVSLQQARAELDNLASLRQKEHPGHQDRWIIEVKPAKTMFVGPSLASTLWSLQAAVGMLLLISCANVGTLLVARTVARQGEFSIRMAIGAARFRLIRQLITESILLGCCAGLLGIFFAWGGIRALDTLYL